MNIFAVRSVIEFLPRQDTKKKHLYEERVTLWKADTFEEAIAKAEVEAPAMQQKNGRFSHCHRHISFTMPSRFPTNALRYFRSSEKATWIRKRISAHSLTRETNEAEPKPPNKAP